MENKKYDSYIIVEIKLDDLSEVTNVTNRILEKLLVLHPVENIKIKSVIRNKGYR